MKNNTLLLAGILAFLLPFQASAFCGFFVANADSKLFNESSEVILVRDGDFSIVIMSNDYQGDVDEFAMIVPVPVVLEEKDIQVADASLFSYLDRYSAPRLTSYNDANPCPSPYRRRFRFGRRRAMCPAYGGGGGGRSKLSFNIDLSQDKGRTYGVQVEAVYGVGQYDILILSANQSNGLKRWLVDEGYNLPDNVDEVLDPYIKGGMKFFVAKVNLESRELGNKQTLKPLSIRYRHDKFMLPIRLGMANSSGTQDLIIYALTNKGRVECTNYRTVKLPSNQNVPTFIAKEFGPFYKDNFELQCEKQHNNSVFLEYAWDISLRTRVKCDPCNGPPPMMAEFQKIGLPWAEDQAAKTFITRLHVRYDRANFPQDLLFQVTPNTTNYQVRHYIKNPARLVECDQARPYLQKLIKRRQHELDKMEELAGWDAAEHYAAYVEPYEKKLAFLDANPDNRSEYFDFETGYIPEDIEPNKATLDQPTSRVLLQIMGYGALLLLLITAIRRMTNVKNKST